jgi:hypothetical protein
MLRLGAFFVAPPQKTGLCGGSVKATTGCQACNAGTAQAACGCLAPLQSLARKSGIPPPVADGKRPHQGPSRIILYFTMRIAEGGCAPPAPPGCCDRGRVASAACGFRRMPERGVDLSSGSAAVIPALPNLTFLNHTAGVLSLFLGGSFLEPLTQPLLLFPFPPKAALLPATGAALRPCRMPCADVEANRGNQRAPLSASTGAASQAQLAGFVSCRSAV